MLKIFSNVINHILQPSGSETENTSDLCRQGWYIIEARASNKDEENKLKKRHEKVSIEDYVDCIAAGRISSSKAPSKKYERKYDTKWNMNPRQWRSGDAWGWVEDALDSLRHWLGWGLANPSFKYSMMFHSSTPKPRQTSVAHPKPLRNCRSLQQFLHIFMLILISFQLFALCLPTSSSCVFLRAFCVFSSSSKCRYSD